MYYLIVCNIKKHEGLWWWDQTNFAFSLILSSVSKKYPQKWVKMSFTLSHFKKYTSSTSFLKNLNVLCSYIIVSKPLHRMFSFFCKLFHSNICIRIWTPSSNWSCSFMVDKVLVAAVVYTVYGNMQACLSWLVTTFPVVV